MRDEVVILGKGAHHSQDRRRVTPFDIQSDIHDSLARFKVDHLDLYLLHRDDPTQPVGPIVETLHAAKEAGQIHAYGGSNWRVQRLREVNEYAAVHGLAPFAVSSPQFSLAVQQEPPWIDCVSLSGPDGECRPCLVLGERRHPFRLVQSGRGILQRPLPPRQPRHADRTLRSARRQGLL